MRNWFYSTANAGFHHKFGSSTLLRSVPKNRLDHSTDENKNVLAQKWGFFFYLGIDAINQYDRCRHFLIKSPMTHSPAVLPVLFGECRSLLKRFVFMHRSTQVFLQLTSSPVIFVHLGACWHGFATTSFPSFMARIASNWTRYVYKNSLAACCWHLLIHWSACSLHRVYVAAPVRSSKM